MGTRASVVPTELSIGTYLKTTHFNESEIRSLFDQFKFISQLKGSDRFIDKAGLEQALGVPHTLFSDRLFAFFDRGKSGRITFDDYIGCLSTMSPKASLEEKIQYSFGFFDIKGDAKITKSGLRTVLEATMSQVSQMLTEHQLDVLVEESFTQADRNSDGIIDFDEYKQWITKVPIMVDFLTVNVHEEIDRRNSRMHM